MTKKHHPCATDPYSYDDWQDMVGWPLKKKVKWSRKTLFTELHKAENPIVSFSGGKSSEVALHLALDFSVWDSSAIYNNTGVVYPETTPFVKRLADEWGFELHITEPEKSFWECVEDYGFPSSSRERSGDPRCCYWLKTRPMRMFVKDNKIDLFITGEQSTESVTRRVTFMQYGEAFRYRRWKANHEVRKCKPVEIWTDADVWDYLEKENLPVNPAYEKYGIGRTGCFTCTGFDGWEAKMRKFSPALYKRVKREKDGLKTLDDF